MPHYTVDRSFQDFCCCQAEGVVWASITVETVVGRMAVICSAAVHWQLWRNACIGEMQRSWPTKLCMQRNSPEPGALSRSSGVAASAITSAARRAAAAATLPPRIAVRNASCSAASRSVRGQIGVDC